VSFSRLHGVPLKDMNIKKKTGYYGRSHGSGYEDYDLVGCEIL
jgi:hypothetical protein